MRVESLNLLIYYARVAGYIGCFSDVGRIPLFDTMRDTRETF